jgi:PAS domain S-box-containing protein
MKNKKMAKDKLPKKRRSLPQKKTPIKASKIQSQKAKRLGDYEYQQLLSIFDSIDEIIYVSDPKTYEVLYVNRSLIKNRGNVIGKKCYKAFQGFDSPCPFCTNKHIFGKKTGQPYIWEFQNKLNLRWYHCIDKAIRWPSGRWVRYEIALDITDRKLAEQALRKRMEQDICYQKALLEITKLDYSNLDSVLKKITEIDSKTLEVKRVSVWLYDKNRSEIICEDLYRATESLHEKGLRLQIQDYPRYFQALEESRTLAADDARKDPRTNEFTKGYLVPLGITSMMDVPIRHQGKVVGILCHEHIGLQREWTLKEQDFAASVADMTSLTLEASERKQAEGALNKSETKYRTLFEASMDAIFLVTIDGHLFDCNTSACVMFGYTKEELLKLSVTDLVPEEFQTKLSEVVTELRKKGTIFTEALYKKKTVEFFPCEINVQMATFGDEQMAIVYVRDITERKKAEETLKEGERFLGSIFNSIQDGISILDKDLNIISVNPIIEQWYSHAMPLAGKKCYKAYHGRDTNCEICPTLQTIKTGKAAFEVVPKTGPGGTKVGWLDLYTFPFVDQKTGQMKGVIEYVRDITERKKAEKVKAAVYKISEAAYSAENLKELFRSIHDVIVELMPAKNFYIALYDSETEMLSFPYFIDEYDEAPVPRKLGRGLTEYVLRTGEPLLASPEKFEELEKKGDVESIGAPSIDWLGVPLKTKDKTIGVLVIQTYTEGIRYGEDVKDMLMFVSTQAAMAIERKQAEEQLHASLLEKEVLLREIHHRVKNNMQVMSSLINLQARHISNREAIDILKEGQSRIRSMALVHEKLYQSKNLAKINIYDYLSSLAAHLFHSYKIDPNLIHFNLNVNNVFLDINSATPCGLIVNELISNSLKHAFPEGRKGEIDIKLYSMEDKKLELIVKDDGVGFPESVDFRQTETLGMQLVNMLVHQLEGTIELLKDGGTEFKIVFKELKYKQSL